jgi:hypothetical protein
MTRDMEMVTLHFDLSHLTHMGVQQDFTLTLPGARTTLMCHNAQTRSDHARTNTALAQLNDEDLSRFTHFAETVSLATDAISFCWVGYPSRRPGAVSDESAVLFQHVPRSAVLRAVRIMRRNGELPTPSRLRPFGVAKPGNEVDVESLHLDASLLVSPASTATTLVMQHPEFGTLVPEDHWVIAEQLIAGQPSFTELYTYLSLNPPEGEDPWYENTYVTDDHGNPVQPTADLTDPEGRPAPWPTTIVDGREVPVIPQHRLSDQLDAVLRPVIQEVGRAVMQESTLKAQQWSTQHGVTGLSRTNTPALQGQPTAVGTHWTLVNKTSMYGLDLYQDSMVFDETTQTLKFEVKNWPNRGLGVYVEFLDVDDKPMNNPKGWRDRLSDWPFGLSGQLQPNPSKKYLRHIGAGNTVFGIPVWTDRELVSFVVPDGAAGANILVGGLGNGDVDMDVDKVGLIYTCVLSYGIPAFLTALSIGVKNTKWYRTVIEDNDLLKGLIAEGMILVKLGTVGVHQTLVWASGKVAGIIFSKSLEKLAKAITGYVTVAEIVDNAPFIGWALRVASLAGSIADMTATSVAVGLSPATYRLQAKRSMTLGISVAPDPRHGIWPNGADHFVIDVCYPGGTTLTKTGRTPARGDAPIRVTYSSDTADAVPAARGQHFQVVAAVYTASNWLCGKWISDWIEAVPTDGGSRTETGSITEQMVPLDENTRYTHTKKLGYDSTAKAYCWADTPNAPRQTTASLSQPGQDLVELTGSTMNDPAHRLGYCYRAKNQNLPMDYDSVGRANPMFVFRSISTLVNPAEGMLAPTRGFSLQPQIAYDHFGSERADGVPIAGIQNFYLDTRTYGTSGLSHLRQVDLSGKGDSTFRYDATLSWGAFGFLHLDAMAVHPNGYVVAVSCQDDKLAIVKLPAAGVPAKEAPQALPHCGTGWREGLLRGPVGLAITLDGRILVLERTSARIQAFDTQANPVRCFAGALEFALDGSGFAAQLDSGTVTPALLQGLQLNVPVRNAAPKAYEPRYLGARVFNLPPGDVSALDAGRVTHDLVEHFGDHGLTLSDDAAIVRTAPGIWLLLDRTTGINYDVRLNGEGGNEVDVYRCFTPTVIVKSPGSEWLLLDKTHTLSFEVTARDGRLRFRSLTACLPLKEGPLAKVTYLDIAVEAKGFIYVLSYVNAGASPTDYRLDIYKPDGTPLSEKSHHGQINAARLEVDRWRALFTLNYEQLQGRGGQPEPTVSQWNTLP